MVFDLGGVALRTILRRCCIGRIRFLPGAKKKKFSSLATLSAHYCEPRMFDDLVTYPKYYEQAVKVYYDAIFSPFKPFVLDGLRKIKI